MHTHTDTQLVELRVVVAQRCSVLYKFVNYTQTHTVSSEQQRDKQAARERERERLSVCVCVCVFVCMYLTGFSVRVFILRSLIGVCIRLTPPVLANFRMPTDACASCLYQMLLHVRRLAANAPQLFPFQLILTKYMLPSILFATSLLCKSCAPPTTVQH